MKAKTNARHTYSGIKSILLAVEKSGIKAEIATKKAVENGKVCVPESMVSINFVA